MNSEHICLSVNSTCDPIWTNNFHTFARSYKAFKNFLHQKWLSSASFSSDQDIVAKLHDSESEFLI